VKGEKCRGLFVSVSDFLKQCPGLFRVIQKDRVFLAKSTCGRAFPPVVGPTWARFGPILFIVFLFLFLPELKKFLKIVEK
jgi:hypothetical protein